MSELSNLMCEAMNRLSTEMSRLRDDLFNQAMLVQPETFAASLPALGTETFTTAQMPPQAGAKNKEAYQNKSNYPMVAYVRAEPVFLAEPPNPIIAEDTFLLVSVNAPATDVARAAVLEASKGKMIAVLLKPNDVLNVAVMASGTVKVAWRVLPLRGRTSIFGNE